MDIDDFLRKHGIDPKMAGERFEMWARLLLVWRAAVDYIGLHSEHEAGTLEDAGKIYDAYAHLCIAIERVHAYLNEVG